MKDNIDTGMKAFFTNALRQEALLLKQPKTRCQELSLNAVRKHLQLSWEYFFPNCTKGYGCSGCSGCKERLTDLLCS